LLRVTELGLYCEAGDFHVDPWAPVDRAVITHAHGDHAVAGCRAYLASHDTAALLRVRLGSDISVESANWGQTTTIGSVAVSLHPAGHILGSSQIRLVHRGETWVVSGDYKTEPDPTCAPFEVVACNTFITESTFGLPIYRWRAQGEVFASMRDWWSMNQREGRASVMFAYALGKAQRLIAGLGNDAPGPIYTHGAVERLNAVYRARGVPLAHTTYAMDTAKGHDFAGSLIIAPPSAQSSTWLRRFGDVSTAFASGWMQIRGARRRRSLDRGFPLSDHADWPSLLTTIRETGATRVLVTHGYRDPLVRWLRAHGLESETIAARWEGEDVADAMLTSGDGS
jgi:putative mRNA 3-end processing factor